MDNIIENIKIRMLELDYNHIYIEKNIIKYDLDKSKIITVPMGLFIKIIQWKNAKLRIGNTEIDVICLPNPYKNILELSEELYISLNLEKERDYMAVLKNNRLHIGPLIGVFYNQQRINAIKNNIINFRTWELVKVNKKLNCILFFFGPMDTDFEKKIINGIYFDNKENRWLKKEFPLLDIFYDREGTISQNQALRCNRVRDFIKNKEDILRINQTHYFDKWDVYKVLINDIDLQEFIPETHLYSRINLNNLLNDFEAVYIKTCLGSNGNKIIKIYKEENSYKISYYKNGIKIKSIDSFESLYERLELLFRGDIGIIQQGIDVIKFQGRNIDFRATVQRDDSGVIKIISYPVRVALRNSPVTNTAANSSVYSFRKFFVNNLNYSSVRIKDLENRIEEFLIKIYETIEKKYGKFGEIGIDFALDNQEKLWFIECNAKPGKDTLFFGTTDNILKEAFENPIEYGKYIWYKSINNQDNPL